MIFGPLPLKTRLARRRFKLWSQDPHCYWCGQETVYRQPRIGRSGRMKFIDADATLDHINPRGHPMRGKSNDVATVLACYKCNNSRGNTFLKAQNEQNPPSKRPIWRNEIWQAMSFDGDWG